MIMLHGRGASAENILGLAPALNLDGFALLAPQATNHTWYPYSFMVPPERNEPWLGSALGLLAGIESDLLRQGISPEAVWFLGFSQGACLTLEYTARHARRYGGVIAFTGGLIGDRIDEKNYRGDFAGTPVFIGSSDPDLHVPVERVRETEKVLLNMHADVHVRIYPDMGHIVSEDEISFVNDRILP